MKQNTNTENIYLNEEEQKQLILDIRSKKKDITELIEFLNPFINKIIKKWYNARCRSSLEYDDLYQQAMVTLIRSVEIFDCNVKGVKFSSYYMSALNSLFMNYIKRYKTLVSGISQLDIKYIDDNLNMISDTIQTIDDEEVSTIDFFLNKGNQLDPMEDYIDYIAFYQTIEYIFNTDRKLKNNERYKKIFDMVFFERLTYEEISNMLDISRQRIGQIMKKIYRVFKNYKDELKPFKELVFSESIIEELKEKKLIFN